MTEIEELRAEIDRLKAELHDLRFPKPPVPPHRAGPYDERIRFGMPQSAVDACVAAVGDKLMRDIVGDHRGKPTSLPGPGPGPEPIPSDRGWVKPAPLAPPASLRRFP
jgi:hypothetical protein